jgi:hypothetical protein
MTRDTYLIGRKSPKVSSKRKGQVLRRVGHGTPNLWSCHTLILVFIYQLRKKFLETGNT